MIHFHFKIYFQTSREESLMARNMSKSQEEDEEEQEQTAEPVKPSGETESEAATELDMESQTSDDVNVVSAYTLFVHVSSSVRCNQQLYYRPIDMSSIACFLIICC